MAALTEFSSDLALFVECGMIAIKQGDEESAKKLFRAAQVIKPDSSEAKTGFGLIEMYKMDLQAAAKIFEEIIAKEASNMRAKAFLSLSLFLEAMEKKKSTAEQLELVHRSAELAQEVAESTAIPSTKQLAESILAWQLELQKKGESLAKAKS